MHRTLLALAAFTVAAPALAAPATVATPVGGWEASSEGGLCRLQRSFEVGGQPHLLILEQSAPGPAVGIALAGPSLAALRPEAPLRVSFAGDHAGFDKRARLEPNRQFGHVAVLQGVWLEKNKPDPAADRGRIDPAGAQAVDRIAVSQGGGAVTFATGSLGEAATVLNACTAQMLRAWNLDPEAQYALGSPAEPEEGEAKLARQLRKAYPERAYRALQNGPVQIVALVDPYGAATACKVIVPSGFEALDGAACKVMAKARYRPARDAAGNPVASYWTTRITFALSETDPVATLP